MSHHSGSKKSVSEEVTSLRKQVADLKESAVARRRVENALRDAELLHRATLDDAPVGILRVDSNGRVQYVNQAFVRALGYESKQDFNSLSELRGVFAQPGTPGRLARELPGDTEISIEWVRKEGSVEEKRVLAGGNPEEGFTLVLAGPLNR